MNDDLELIVRTFVAEEIGSRQLEVRLDTTLLGGLGVTGDDAYDFFVAFAKRFDVDVSSLDLAVHFDDEGGTFGDLARMLVAWIRNPSASPEARSGLIPITVADLIQAVRRGRWELSS
jgi:hypothetical protein